MKETHGETKPAKNLSDLPRFLGEMRRLIRMKHYSYSTERTYLDWAKRFFAYVEETKKRGDAPSVIGPDDVKDFLSHLAIKQRVSASTQNQAFNALLFLFREVLREDFGDQSGAIRAKRGKRLPVVLSIDEVKALFKHLSGQTLLMAQILYGAGLRLMELARLRVNDIDAVKSDGTISARRRSSPPSGKLRRRPVLQNTQRFVLSDTALQHIS